MNSGGAGDSCGRWTYRSGELACHPSRSAFSVAREDKDGMFIFQLSVTRVGARGIWDSSFGGLDGYGSLTICVLWKPRGISEW